MKIIPAFFLWLAAISFVPAAPELGKWWKDSEVVARMNLTDAQVNKIEQVFLDFRSKLSRLNSDLKNKESELSALMSADPLDPARIRATTDRVAMSRAELEKANTAMMLAIRQEISKDQWNKLQEIRLLRESSAAIAAPGGPSKIVTPSGEAVYTVGSPVRAPRVLFQPKPQYTQAAREAKIEGIALLQGIVRKNGRVTDLKVLRGLGYGLDQNAVSTIGNEWRFEPGTMNGEPVNVQVNIEVSFRRF